MGNITTAVISVFDMIDKISFDSSISKRFYLERHNNAFLFYADLDCEDAPKLIDKNDAISVVTNTLNDLRNHDELDIEFTNNNNLTIKNLYGKIRFGNHLNIYLYEDECNVQELLDAISGKKK